MKNKIILILFIFNICISLSVAQNPNLAWCKQVGSSYIDIGYSIASDAMGNTYTTGFFWGVVDFDPGPATYTLSASKNDVFVLKLDPAGNFIWAKKMGGAGNNSGLEIAIDALSNVYIGGEFQSTVDFDPGPGVFNLTAISLQDAFMVKLDASGNFIWAKQLEKSSIGGIVCNGISNIYITGKFTNTVDFDPGIGTYNLSTSNNRPDAYVWKLDAIGNFIWAKQLGGSGYEYGSAISIDKLGNVYTTGQFQFGFSDFDPGPGTYTLAPSGNSDVFISKLDSSGNFVWAKQMGGSSNFPEEGFAIMTDASNNIYSSGYFHGTSDFDPGSGVFNLTSSGAQDIFISKLDANGNFIWAKRIGGTSQDIGRSIALDASKNIYLTGEFGNSADFDPGSGVFNLTTQGSVDIFVLKLDSLGNFSWAVSFGDTDQDFGLGIALDQIGAVYTTGAFRNTVDFDPNSGVFNLTSSPNGMDDIFIHKMYPSSVYINETVSINNNLVYPNPFSNKITVLSSTNINYITIYNSIGLKVYETIPENEKTEIDMGLFSSGIYFVKIGAQTKKIIKE